MEGIGGTKTVRGRIFPKNRSLDQLSKDVLEQLKDRIVAVLASSNLDVTVTVDQYSAHDAHLGLWLEAKSKADLRQAFQEINQLEPLTGMNWEGQILRYSRQDLYL